MELIRWQDVFPVWEREAGRGQQGQEKVGREGAGGTSQQVAWEPMGGGVAGG